MKAISTHAHITSIRSRRDGSLGFSVETPELGSPEKVAFLDLQGKNLKMLIEHEEGSDEVLEIMTDLDIKTPSQRLRGLIYKIHKESGSDKVFSVFYEEIMEKILDGLKRKYLD